MRIIADRRQDHLELGTGLLSPGKGTMHCQLGRLISIWHLLVKKRHGCPSENRPALWLFICSKSMHLLPLACTGLPGALIWYSQYSDAFWQVGMYLFKAPMCTGRIHRHQISLILQKMSFPKNPTPKLIKLENVSVATETALNVNQCNVA